VSKKESTEKLYTLPRDYAEDLLDEVSEVIEVCLENIEHIRHDQHTFKKTLLSLIVDCLWSNFSIKKLINLHVLGDPVPYIDEETGEESLMITSTTLKSLQDFVIARHLANAELSRYSISVSMH
tara:strand:+ start:2496 stop:2867 length:372 start_codon:yes stop_codon:yes gene_type:complete